MVEPLGVRLLPLFDCALHQEAFSMKILMEQIVVLSFFLSSFAFLLSKSSCVQPHRLFFLTRKKFLYANMMFLSNIFHFCINKILYYEILGASSGM